MRKYDITDHRDMIDVAKWEWLNTLLKKDQYKIHNDGFLLDSYHVSFPDPAAETLYLLRWA